MLRLTSCLKIFHPITVHISRLASAEISKEGAKDILRLPEDDPEINELIVSYIIGQDMQSYGAKSMAKIKLNTTRLRSQQRYV